MTSKSYEVVYHPLTMTTNESKHTGTIFFLLPAGQGLLYNLTGTADNPRPNAKITRDIPAKTSYTDLLTVYNWLPQAQRFQVHFEVLRCPSEQVTNFKGLKYIDVPGKSEKEYKLNFFAYKEGTSTAKVIFRNEESKEYQYYDVTFRVGKPGIMDVLCLATPVRQTTCYKLNIDNPLENSTTFSVSCNVPEVQRPTQITIPAESQGVCTLEYMPLKTGEMQARLELYSNELGLYLYELKLQATAASNEKALHFCTFLGSQQILPAKFISFAKQKTDYSCKIDSQEFQTVKTVSTVAAGMTGIEAAVEVTFEPSYLGNTKATLIVTSPTGSEYIFPLFSTCVPPRPQGPITVHAGVLSNILFKNVFHDTHTFTYHVNNPMFMLHKMNDVVKAKKEQRVSLGFNPKGNDPLIPVTGLLTISCQPSAGSAKEQVTWIYYLKGLAN